MSSPFSLTASELAELVRSRRLQEDAEAVLLELWRGGPPRPVPADVLDWVVRIAPDPVFCADPSLASAGDDLLEPVLRGVSNLTIEDLTRLSSRTVLNEGALAALLSHAAAGEGVWAETLWSASRHGTRLPGSLVPPTAFSRALLALFPTARSFWFEGYVSLARRLSASDAAVEVFVTLLADLGPSHRLALPPRRVEELVSAALSVAKRSDPVPSA